MGVGTIKQQIMAMYGCVAAGQSPWVRDWAAAKAVCRLCSWWQRYFSCSMWLIELYKFYVLFAF